MNDLETKIRNVIKAWKNCLYDHFRNDELLCSMEDAMLDLESLLDRPAPTLNAEHKGDIVSVHCCDSCARHAKVTPKSPPDSGAESWFCEVCGHYGIGSRVDCEIGDWLILHPVGDLTTASTGPETAPASDA